MSSKHMEFLGIYTRHTSLRAASHRAISIGYVQNQHPINAMNPICLNSFRIKSAQSSGRRREQNYAGIADISRGHLRDSTAFLLYQSLK